MTLDEYVSSVTVTYNRYSLNTDKDEIYNDTLDKGRTRIEFSSPYKPESVSASAGAIIEEVKTNYIVINMPKKGTCAIMGLGYTATETKYRAEVPLIPSGESENNKDYGGCTLVNAARAKAVAEYILNYLQMRQVVNVEFINDGELVGNWCNISDRKTRIFTTGITQQKLNLAGGNISTAVCRGYETVITDYSYTGEIYAEGDVVI